MAVGCALGFLILFGMRCNLGIAILELNKYDNPIHSNASVEVYNNTINYNYKNNNHRNSEIIGLINSSFFFGYIITQIPGGYMSTRYPSNIVFGYAIGLSCLLNLIVPFAFKINYICLILVRILQGLIEGVTYPACHGLWRYWAPPFEHSRLSTISFSGSYAGVFIGMPLTSIMTQYCDWQSSFILYGIVGLIWCFFWIKFSAVSPNTHKYITDKEIDHIELSLLSDQSRLSLKINSIFCIPWKSIFTSKPVYAIIIANMCRSWSFYLLIIMQIKFFKQKYNLKLATGGFYAALPHIIMTFVVLFGGWASDKLRKKGVISTTNVRKLFNCGGFGLEALFLLVVAYSESSSSTIIYLTFAVGFSGFAISGYNVNHLDIAPVYASIIMGISNAFGTISGILCPIITEEMTKNGSHEWKNVFIMAACIHIFGVIFYGINASGEIQHWAKSKKNIPDDLYVGYNSL